MGKSKEELELEAQVEKIRSKRRNHDGNTRIRTWLNTVFLILATIGLIWYFTDSQHHIPALATIGVGMLLKIVEFFIRFVF